MLKISAEDEPHQLTLKLEGSLAGTWVVELAYGHAFLNVVHF
jgi:hypothetical protein